MLKLGLTTSFHSTLLPHEPPATGAKSLSSAARDALLACATAGRLIGTRAGGWHTPDGSHPRPIARRTFATLRRLGLVSVRTYRGSRTAQLTGAGHWFARTLCASLAGNISINQGETDACRTTDC